MTLFWLHPVMTGSIDGKMIGAGLVTMLASVTLDGDTCVIAILFKFDFISEQGRCTKWRATEDVFLCTAENIRCATSWSEPAANAITTLKPIVA